MNPLSGSSSDGTGAIAMMMAGSFHPPIFFSVLPKRLRPQARVVGQPPHKRRHLGRRQTGRARKGYAASVSGKAANGCAVDGPKEKNAKRRTCAFAQVGLSTGAVLNVC